MTPPHPAASNPSNQQPKVTRACRLRCNGYSLTNECALTQLDVPCSVVREGPVSVVYVPDSTRA